MSSLLINYIGVTTAKRVFNGDNNFDVKKSKKKNSKPAAECASWSIDQLARMAEANHNGQSYDRYCWK